MLTGEWKITRPNGEGATIQADTEREATLLGRESWPGEAFTIELISRSCVSCGASFGPKVKGGCPACRAQRDERKRPYLATVTFLLKGGWSKPYTARVRGFGIVGATAVAVREAKLAIVKPRARITEMKVSLIPVRK